MISSEVDYNNYLLAKLKNDVGELRDFTSRWTSWAKDEVRRGEVARVLVYLDEVNDKVERACRSVSASPFPTGARSVFHVAANATATSTSTSTSTRRHSMSAVPKKMGMDAADYHKAFVSAMEDTTQMRKRNCDARASLTRQNSESKKKSKDETTTMGSSQVRAIRRDEAAEFASTRKWRKSSKSSPVNSISIPTPVLDVNASGNGNGNGNQNPKASVVKPAGKSKSSVVGNGKIVEPNRHDVLKGRGYKIIFKKGNEYFRNLVNALRYEYVASPKQDKAHFAEKLHEHIRTLDPPGRFLKMSDDKQSYIEIPYDESLRKTSQALREEQPEIRRKIESGEVEVKVVKKNEVAYLISERARMIYSKVFPEYAAAMRESEDFLPSAPTPSADLEDIEPEPFEHTPSPTTSDYDSDDEKGTEDFLPSEGAGFVDPVPSHAVRVSTRDSSLRKGVYVSTSSQSSPVDDFNDIHQDKLGHGATSSGDEKRQQHRDSIASLSRSLNSCSIMSVGSITLEVSDNDGMRQSQKRSFRTSVRLSVLSNFSGMTGMDLQDLEEGMDGHQDEYDMNGEESKVCEL